MEIFTVFSERRFSEGRRVKLSQKKAQFHNFMGSVIDNVGRSVAFPYC
jgi:hypothetical protein